MNSAALPFMDLNDGVLEDSLVPHNIDKVLQKLEEPGVDDEGVQDEGVSTSGFDEPGESPSEERELDLSAGELDKTADPVRLYMREMGTVPLLTRVQEVAIAKRIEWGQNRAQKAITRSPIAVAELLKIGVDLEAGTLAIRDLVSFSDQMEAEEQEDKSEEYLQWTIEGIQNVGKLYRRGLKQ